MGISRHTAKILADKAVAVERHAAHDPDIACSLPSRQFYVLRQCGVRGDDHRADVAVKLQHIDLLRVKNCGIKTAAQIRGWLGGK